PKTSPGRRSWPRTVGAIPTRRNPMRRPGIRSLAGGAAGIVAGVIGGIALTSTSTASGPALAVPGLDAVHIPPVLTTKDQPVTVPAGGETAPQRSFPLRDATEVDLGPHTFGRDRAPDERIVTAPWGSDVGEVGLAGSRELGFSGPSSFDVAADGTIAVLDQVN